MEAFGIVVQKDVAPFGSVYEKEVVTGDVFKAPPAGIQPGF